MMRRVSRSTLYVVIATVAVGSVVAFSWNWYNTRIVWPAEIQRSLIGGELAGYASLNSYEGESHWGQGMFRWSYDLNLTPSDVGKYCAGGSAETCRFQRTGSPSPGVTTSIVIEGRYLTIEEWWL